MTDPAPPGASPSDPKGLDFRELVDRFVDAVIVHDGRALLYANQAAADLVGAPAPGPLVGRPLLDFVAPESQSSVVARARALTLTGGVKAGNERVFRRLDGSRVTVETVGIALGGGRALVVIRDLSGQSRAERGRLTAEAHLAAFSDVAIDGIAIARNSDGRHVMVNAAHARMFGFDRPEDEAGTTFMDLIAPSARPQMEEIARRFRTGELRSHEFLTRGLRRDGVEFDLEVRAGAFPDGDELLIAATLRDVTERRELERRLRESERRFRELFEFVPVSLWEVDASAVRAALDRLRDDGVTDLRAHVEAHPELLSGLMRSFRVTAVNAFGRVLVGAKSHEELLAGLDRVHGPVSFERLLDLGGQLYAGRGVAEAEGWGATVGGDRRWLSTAAIVIPGHEADWRRLLFASVDLTERRRAEEERAVLQERLRHSEKLEAIGRLAGGIAHDFNNILSGILGYAELTQLALDRDGELFDHQQRIREATLRARSLVRQILTFSRRDLAHQRRVDVPSVVGEALALARAAIPASITLEPRLDPAAGATEIDPTQLHQVVLNLCSNARDAVGAHGRIEVEVAAVAVEAEAPDLAPGRYVRLRVRDDGTGMDDETRARIFEPYMTTKGPFGGHGLGLPVVHGIVTGAGGAVRVETAPGRGSTFDVYLPWQAAEVAAAPAPAAAPRGRGARVLLAEDEPLVREAQRRVLESLGYAVEPAADGAEALARFREAPASWALVLTDLSMPRMGGLELAREVVALRPELPVVLLTGYGEALDEVTVRRDGIRTVLQKPTDRSTLAGVLEAVLARGLEG